MIVNRAFRARVITALTNHTDGRDTKGATPLRLDKHFSARFARFCLTFCKVDAYRVSAKNSRVSFSGRLATESMAAKPEGPNNSAT